MQMNQSADLSGCVEPGSSGMLMCSLVGLRRSMLSDGSWDRLITVGIRRGPILHELGSSAHAFKLVLQNKYLKCSPECESASQTM